MIKQRTIADSLSGYSIEELRRMARANGNDGKTRRYHGPYKRRPYVPDESEYEAYGSRRRPREERDQSKRSTDSVPSSGPHAVLGVRPGATREEIRSAYRALAHKFHPDHGGSVEKMREINLAYAAIVG
jgi:DnaJ-domain-containing protein 1